MGITRKSLSCSTTFTDQALVAGKAEDPLAGESMVVMLHGLGRTRGSFRRMDAYLQSHGFRTARIGYPSRKYNLEEQARSMAERLKPLIEKWEQLHFVTHSFGGILLRHLAQGPLCGRVGRAVMLAPPNQGSEVVDWLGSYWFFRWFNGPAALQLGTAAESAPNCLGAVDFDLGVIAGDRFLDVYFARCFPGPHDGKVSVARTRVEGMRAFKVVHATHTFMMRHPLVMENTAIFLERGRFLEGAVSLD